MLTITIDDMQLDIAGYMSRVRAGETLLILQAGQPFAEIKPISKPSKKLRPFGLCKGEFIVPDDFDAPLSDWLLHEFEGK